MSDELPSWWPLVYDTHTPKNRTHHAPGVNLNFNGQLYCVMDWSGVVDDDEPFCVWTGTVEKAESSDRKILGTNDLLEVLCVLIELERNAATMA